MRMLVMLLLITIGSGTTLLYPESQSEDGLFGTWKQLSQTPSDAERMQVALSEPAFVARYCEIVGTFLPNCTTLIAEMDPSEVVEVFGQPRDATAQNYFGLGQAVVPEGLPAELSDLSWVDLTFVTESEGATVALGGTSRVTTGYVLRGNQLLSPSEIVESMRRDSASDALSAAFEAVFELITAGMDLSSPASYELRLDGDELIMIGAPLLGIEGTSVEYVLSREEP